MAHFQHIDVPSSHSIDNMKLRSTSKKQDSENIALIDNEGAASFSERKRRLDSPADGRIPKRGRPRQAKPATAAIGVSAAELSITTPKSVAPGGLVNLPPMNSARLNSTASNAPLDPHLQSAEGRYRELESRYAAIKQIQARGSQQKRQPACIIYSHHPQKSQPFTRARQRDQLFGTNHSIFAEQEYQQENPWVLAWRDPTPPPEEKQFIGNDRPVPVRPTREGDPIFVGVQGSHPYDHLAPNRSIQGQWRGEAISRAPNRGTERLKQRWNRSVKDSDGFLTMTFMEAPQPRMRIRQYPLVPATYTNVVPTYQRRFNIREFVHDKGQDVDINTKKLYE